MKVWLYDDLVDYEPGGNSRWCSVEEAEKEIERLKKERDWWKKELEKEIQGSFFSNEIAVKVIQQYAERMEKALEEE